MVRIFTDGACSGSPGAGGWAYIIQFSEKDFKILSGGHRKTFAHQMEARAIIEALKYVDNFFISDEEIKVFCDQKGLVDVLQQMQLGIKTKPFRESEDLWVELEALVLRHPEVKFKWIRRGKNKFNMLVDMLAKHQKDYRRQLKNLRMEFLLDD